MVARLIRGALAKRRVKIYAFGSRVAGDARPGSDLDVVLWGKTELPGSVLADVDDVLAESRLPFRVDVLDYHRLSKDFLAKIRRYWVEISA
jgi:predicted nucleotidyltransferase